MKSATSSSNGHHGPFMEENGIGLETGRGSNNSVSTSTHLAQSTSALQQSIQPKALVASRGMSKGSRIESGSIVPSSTSISNGHLPSSAAVKVLDVNVADLNPSITPGKSKRKDGGSHGVKVYNDSVIIHKDHQIRFF